jgi:TRAP transporter 4TM/12TM fusion protein
MSQDVSLRIQDVEGVFGGFRELSGVKLWFGNILLVLIPISAVIFLLNLIDLVGDPIWSEQYYGFFLGISLAATFFWKPASTKSRFVVPWYDWVFCVVGLGIGFHLAVYYPALILDAFNPVKTWGGVVLLVLLAEATRRFFGWTIVILALVFVLFAHFAYLAPYPLTLKGVEWDRLLSYIYADTGAILGPPIAVASTTALVFVLFGELLNRSGGANFIQNFSERLTGSYVGGGAKVSVVSSGLMGTISGSVISNVMITGQVSIPMMRASGYTRAQAAAVEAVASTGGAIMPPIMGAAAFIMADFLGKPYAEVAKAAIIPALLYYFCVFCQVDLMARRDGIKARSDLIHAGSLLSIITRQGWSFFIPFGALIFLLFFDNIQAETAGIWASGVALLVLLARVRSEIFLSIGLLLVGTGRVMLNLAIVCAVSGVIVGAITVSGLGFRLSYILVSVGNQSLLALALLVAFVSIILGMGMPATAVYVLLATLVAPAMVEVGASPMAAHMFVFYFGLMSLITPPICLAVFAAATLSGSSPWETGFEAVKLAIVAYVVPFLFLFGPPLLLQGSMMDIIIAVTFALLGTFLLCIAVSGFWRGHVTATSRIFLVMAAALCLNPVNSGIMGFRTEIVGLLMAVLFFFWIHRGVDVKTSKPNTSEAL